MSNFNCSCWDCDLGWNLAHCRAPKSMQNVSFFFILTSFSSLWVKFKGWQSDIITRRCSIGHDRRREFVSEFFHLSQLWKSCSERHNSHWSIHTIWPLCGFIWNWSFVFELFRQWATRAGVLQFRQSRFGRASVEYQSGCAHRRRTSQIEVSGQFEIFQSHGGQLWLQMSSGMWWLHKAILGALL